MKRLAVPVLLLGLLIPASALAHQKSVSYSKWTLVDDGAIAEVKVRWLELTSLPVVRDATPGAYERSGVLPYLQTKLSLESDAGPCEAIPSSATWLPAEGKKAIDDWLNSYKKGCEDFKNLVDENYQKVEDFFAGSEV